MTMPSMPRRPISARASEGKLAVRSHSAAKGASRSAANWRAISRTMACSWGISIVSRPGVCLDVMFILIWGAPARVTGRGAAVLVLSAFSAGFIAQEASSSGDALHRHRGGLSAADAERRDTPLEIVFLQSRQQCNQDAGTRVADRMP